MKAKEFIKEAVKIPDENSIDFITNLAGSSDKDPTKVSNAFNKLVNLLGSDETNEAAYEGNLGMMEMFKFKQIATPEQKTLMNKLISLKKYKQAWDLLKQVTGVNLKEAETDTLHSKEIANKFKTAGYKQIGSGADSTIWDNDTGNVVKIIMPEEGGTAAAETFRKFVEFCIQHQDLNCVPRFLSMNGKVVQDFKVLDKDYQMVTMEKLRPIKQKSFEEGMIWQLSDYAIKDMPWNKVKEELSYPDVWVSSDMGDEKTMSDIVYNMPTDTEQKYKVLYNVMTFLYLRGKINKLGWDLHTENVMMRSNGDLVIIDPWFNINN